MSIAPWFVCNTAFIGSPSLRRLGEPPGSPRPPPRARFACGGCTASSKCVRQGFDCARRRREPPGLEPLLDLARELERLALLVRVEHRVDGGEHRAAAAQLDVDGLG